MAGTRSGIAASYGLRPRENGVVKTEDIDQLRRQLVEMLDARGAHMPFEPAVADFPAGALNQVVPNGIYTPWHLLEHIRIAQRDILDFCRDPKYVEPRSMAEYWPASAAPPGPEGWDESVAAFRADREAIRKIAREGDLFSAVPRGTGQTFLREVVLVADHNAYTLGQLVVLRRLLGIWPRG